MEVFKVRDLSLIDTGESYIVIAVDSFGGIGPKECDVVKLPVGKWGRAILRVPIMEVIASGAEPILVIDALGVEYDPMGKEVIIAIREELSRLGYKDIPITGSTEDNVPVKSSAAGVVVIGEASKGKFYPGTSKEGDNLFVVGIPKVGKEIKEDLLEDQEIPDILDLILLRGLIGVHDILPVGSRGILYEAYEMAKNSHLNLILLDNVSIDLRKSAGPSTCFLVSTSLTKREIVGMVKPPVTLIGKLESGEKR